MHLKAQQGLHPDEPDQPHVLSVNLADHGHLAHRPNGGSGADHVGGVRLAVKALPQGPAKGQIHRAGEKLEAPLDDGAALALNPGMFEVEELVSSGSRFQLCGYETKATLARSKLDEAAKTWSECAKVYIGKSRWDSRAGP